MKSKEEWQDQSKLLQDQSKLFVNDALQYLYSRDMIPIMVIGLSRTNEPVITVSKPTGVHIDAVIEMLQIALQEVMKDRDRQPIAPKTPTT